jgi:hypothetical protein
MRMRDHVCQLGDCVRSSVRTRLWQLFQAELSKLMTLTPRTLPVLLTWVEQQKSYAASLLPGW